MSQTLPDFVIKTISDIQQRTGISRDEIARDYNEIFSDPFISEDPQFKTDEERHKYAKAVLWTRYVSRPPMKEYDVIPWGFEGERITRKGTAQSSVHAFIKTNQGTKNRRVVLRGDLASKIREITQYAKYTVKLGEFQAGGDMIGDNRTRFVDPIAINISPEKLIERINAKRLSLKDVEKFPSKIGSDGYVDQNDLRVVRGIMIRPTRWERDDHTFGGVFTLADDTLDEEPRVSPDGTIITPGLTCWVAPHLLVYQPESEVDAIGTTRKSKKTGEMSMNVFCILPVHAKKMAEME